MKFEQIVLHNDLDEIKRVIQKSFLSTGDSDIYLWFSFSIMEKKIKENEAICLKALEKNKIIGVIYIQEENPINSIEGTEKWVISLLAVLPEYTGKGVGTQLLQKIEKEVKPRSCKKIFTYTNINDNKVINFYKENGYLDVGYIHNYRYGEDNSAIFLLKKIG